MEELTLEFKMQNVTEEQEQAMAKLQADIETDVAFVAANSLEEIYVAVKKYVKLTLEQFKAAYENVKEKVAGLFEEVQAKRELSDEELDIVAGGGGFGSWFKKNWKKVAVGATLAVGAALMVAGFAIAGAATSAVTVPALAIGMLVGGSTTLLGGMVGVVGMLE